MIGRLGHLAVFCVTFERGVSVTQAGWDTWRSFVSYMKRCQCDTGRLGHLAVFCVPFERGVIVTQADWDTWQSFVSHMEEVSV